MKNPMAYGKLRDLVQLATELQASSIGLTIDEICEKTERSRKTVQRMLNGLYELGLEPTSVQLETDHHLTKRWKIEGGVPAELLILEKAERTGLERLLDTLAEGTVRDGLSKVLAKSEPLGKHIAVDTAELIERTTHIGNIGPRQEVKATQMSKFENAILGFARLKIKYRTSGKAKASCLIVISLLDRRPYTALFQSERNLNMPALRDYFVAFIAALLAAAALTWPAMAAEDDPVVATVNGEKILRKAFSEKVEGFPLERKLVLSGYPKVLQGRDVIKGNKIIIREEQELVEILNTNSRFYFQDEVQ